MPIRKFTNGRFSLKRFTAPGVGGGGTTPGPAAPTTRIVTQLLFASQTWTPPSGVSSVDYVIVAGGGAGGSGIAIYSYPVEYANVQSLVGGTYSEVSGQRILRFAGAGSFTLGQPYDGG